jgi:hypothetical protein
MAKLMLAFRNFVNAFKNGHEAIHIYITPTFDIVYLNATVTSVCRVAKALLFQLNIYENLRKESCRHKPLHLPHI